MSFKLFFILCVLSFAAHAAGPVLEKGIGHLTDLEGEVLVNGSPANENTTLSVGTVVETRQGKCTLLLGKETVMRLGEESKLKITEYLLKDSEKKETSSVDLNFGRLRALLKTKTPTKKSFNVRSRAAVIGVRGTHIVVDSPRDLSRPQRFVTVEGVADLSIASLKPSIPARAIALKENESFVMSEGADPAKAQIVPLSVGAVREITEQVAPAPKDVRGREELRPAKPEVLAPQIAPPRALLDPVANGGGNPSKGKVRATIEVR